VRDLYPPREGARVISRALGGLGVIAMLSPIVGGVLVQWISWHAALLVLALFGAGTLAFVALRFEETIPNVDPHAMRLAQLWRNWCSVLADRCFRAWTALMCLSFAGLFCLLAGSSFVFIEVLGVSRVAYGIIIATNSVAYVAGTWLCRRLLRGHGLRGTVRIGARLSLAGGLGMAGLSLIGVQGVWAIMLPQYLFAMGHGIHQSCGQAGAVGPFPEKAGSAAALAGFLMMLTAFGVGLGLGKGLNGTVYPVTLGVGAISIALAWTAWTLVQRDGEPTAAPHDTLTAAEAT
jgi:DHA1 family bicyclomycin/chloramphenicol resistance-like MFS transporter